MLLQRKKYRFVLSGILLCTLIGAFSFLQLQKGVAGATAAANALVTVASTQWDNGIGIYSPGASPKLTVKLQNKQATPQDGQVKVTLQDDHGAKLWQGQTSYHLAANQVSPVTLATTTLKKSGWVTARVEASTAGTVQSTSTVGLSVVPQVTAQGAVKSNAVAADLPSRPTGVLPDSYFGMGFDSGADQNATRQIAQQIGARWSRGANNCDLDTVEPSNGTYWSQDQINACRNEIQAWNNAGVEVLNAPIYGPCWNTDQSLPCYASRPTDFNIQADAMYHLVQATQDLTPNYELHNEPWVHGWSWQNGEAQDYRDYSKAIWDRVKADYPNVNLIGGGSVPYNRDVVYAKGSTNAGYIDGSISHAYGFPDPAQMGATATQAALDKLYSQTNGRAGEWQTELGTKESDFPGLSNSDQRLWVARTLGPTYLLQILGATSQGQPVHVFWFTLDYGGGAGPDGYNIYDGTNPKPAVSAYSIMTQALEGKKMVGDIYDQSKGVWAFLFQDANGNGSVALYADQNYHGSISLGNASGIEAYDYLGNQISDGSQSSLNVTLNPMETTYFVSNRSVSDIKSLFQNAPIQLNTEVKVSPLSFTHAVDSTSTVDVKVQNVTNRTLNATLNVSAPSGWTLSSTSQSVNSLAPGEIRVVSFPASAVSVAGNNQYTVNYTLTTDDSTTETGSQVIQVAYAPKETFNVDGDLSDWSNVPAVTVGKGHDQLRTAWDDNYFYIGANVDDANPVENKPFSQDPYSFPFNASGIQLAFDVVPHNPDDLLYGQSEYEKAKAADIDYEFDATLTSAGTPEVQRLQAPGTNYQTYYPTNADLTPKLGPIDASPSGGSEGKIQIVRNGNQTVYELAIAWSALPDVQNIVKGLSAGQLATMNFAFAVDGGDAGTTYWTTEAGQVESGAYGFSPHWGTGQAQQGGRIVTRWGLLNGVGGCSTSCSTPTPTPTTTPSPTPTATATATATPVSGSLVTAINAGGNSSGSFVADTDYDTGNQYSDTSSTIDTSGVSNPAPQDVYQSCRWNSAFTYTIPGLTAGASYKVRLHFAELSFDTAGQRVFNVAINGSSVLSNFDVVATAGGQKKALVEEFTVKADSNGKIAIAFTQGSADNPFVSGIEVYTT